MREDGEGQWQDWLADDNPLQDERVADAEERDIRHSLLLEAMGQPQRSRKIHI
jgi:RNA polymerase sigma-32 factor